MRIFTNEKLIKRYARVSKVLSTAGILVLLSGLAASFLRPEWYSLPFYTLIAGFMLSNIGMFLANRYVREPRPDLVLRNSMKASRIEKNSWEIGALIGTIGDSSDVPYLLKFWRKFQ